jgi:hypothetical protein
MNNLKVIVTSTILAVGLSTGTTLAQETPLSTPAAGASSNSNTAPVAVHLIGLPDVPPAATGSLKLTREGLEFTSNKTESDISYKQISAVYAGVNKTESGGKAGFVARKLPYGVGPIFSLASKKQEDLLTVEFRDIHGGYHGTVFALPFKRAAALQATIAEHISKAAPAVESSCSMPLSHSVLLAPIQEQGMPLPAEYRILLYEQVQHALSETDTRDSYLRPGVPAAAEGCTPFTLHIDVRRFTKGNQTVRAATGPIGFFIDATSLTFDVRLDGPGGKVLLDQEIKKSKRGDTDSLKLAQDIGKDLSKRVDKVMEQTRDGAHIS